MDEEILAAEAALIDAQMRNDVAALDRLLDDELIFVALDGSVVGKADDLAAHRARRLRLTRMHREDIRLTHLGESAVCITLFDHAGTWDGAPVSGRLRYTRVWHRRPDGWRIVAGHMTLLGR